VLYTKDGKYTKGGPSSVACMVKSARCLKIHSFTQTATATETMSGSGVQSQCYKALSHDAITSSLWGSC